MLSAFRSRSSSDESQPALIHFLFYALSLHPIDRNPLLLVESGLAIQRSNIQ